MSRAFMKESDDQWLSDVAPTLSALLLYLTRENNGITVVEERLTIDHDGREELVGVGMNDIDDASPLSSFGVLVALDPMRVVGERRSTTAPIFELPPSDAERYYVAFPNTQIDTIAGRHSSIYFLEKVDSTMYEAASARSYGQDGAIHYYLSSNVEVVYAKSDDSFDAAVIARERSGIPMRRIDGAYLRHLRDAVRYWNGKAWSHSPVHVGTPNIVP